MTSTTFVAELPECITDQQICKLVTWGRENCVRSDLTFTGEGKLRFTCTRRAPKTTRDFQKLLSTHFKNWGLVTGRKVGWLALIPEEEFDTYASPPKKAELNARFNPPEQNKPQFYFKPPVSLLAASPFVYEIGSKG